MNKVIHPKNQAEILEQYGQCVPSSIKHANEGGTSIVSLKN